LRRSRIGPDALSLLEQAVDGLRQLLPALGIERHRTPDERGIGVVEAAGGRRRAGVVVDHLQRGANGRLLGDRRACSHASSLIFGRARAL
jgi:hypothetical protein